MRIVTLVMCCAVVCAGGAADAQNEPAAGGRSASSQAGQADDEVIVTGKQLGQLRAQLQNAREHAWLIFNDINSTNDFDVHCKNETHAFSHGKVRVCRPQFEGRITNTAAKEYLAALFLVCPGGPDGLQACMTGAYAQRGLARAQAVSGEAPGKRDQFADEILRLASENEQFAQAILDTYALQQKYDAARQPAPRPKGDD
jgi:hypothetical protein